MLGLINYFNKVIESPIIRINKIGGIISDKLKGNTNIINEIFSNKEKERQLRTDFSMTPSITSQHFLCVL